MANVLEVKNLKISFRTTNGTVKAVRNISFNLEKGKTLAIVGESGSGKSVTSKAVLGSLAGPSIVEGGPKSTTSSLVRHSSGGMIRAFRIPSALYSEDALPPGSCLDVRQNFSASAVRSLDGRSLFFAIGS